MNVTFFNRLSVSVVTATHQAIFIRPLKRVGKRIRTASISPSIWQIGVALKMNQNEKKLPLRALEDTVGQLIVNCIKKRTISVIAQPVVNPAAGY